MAIFLAISGTSVSAFWQGEFPTGLLNLAAFFMYLCLEVGADGFLNPHCHIERKVYNREMVTPYSCTLRTIVRTSPVVRALAVAYLLRVKPGEDTVKAV